MILFFNIWLLLFPYFIEPAEVVCLSPAEREMYGLLNRYRKEKKLPSIPLSASLTQVAQAHVRDLMENYMRSEVCNPHSWSDQGPWTSCCYTSDHKQAECMWNKPKEIANYDSPGYEIAFWHSLKATPPEAMAGWKKSPGHNPVMVNLDTWKKVEWKAVGVGIYEQYAVIWFGEEPDAVKATNCQ